MMNDPGNPTVDMVKVGDGPSTDTPRNLLLTGGIYCRAGATDDPRAIATLPFRNAAGEEFEVALTPGEAANIANALSALLTRHYGHAKWRDETLWEM